MYFYKTILILSVETWQLVHRKQNKFTDDSKMLNMIRVEIVLASTVLIMLTTTIHDQWECREPGPHPPLWLMETDSSVIDLGFWNQMHFRSLPPIHILCMKKLIISEAFNLLLGSPVMLTFCYATFRRHKAIFVLAYKWHFRTSEECLKTCTVSYPLIRAEVQILWTVSLCVCPRGREQEISSSWSLQITTCSSWNELVWSLDPDSICQMENSALYHVIRQDACEEI